MKTYKYATNWIDPGKLEDKLNELGKHGWKLRHIEWYGATSQWMIIVEKTIEHA
ncbi:hypothetical protein M0R04_08655 [Candidatus Dojkabacteria bacterium]|jgi:hypothetical protein|nr:hypothetical protein [Candidatus Dojkabacteria bacterium]